MKAALHISLAILFSLPALPAFAGTYVIDSKNGVVIDGQFFTDTSGHCMQIYNSKNITIRNSKFVTCGEDGIRIDDSSGITIESNYFENTASHAILAVNSSTIAVSSNKFKNTGGTFPMFIDVKGPSTKIVNNVGINEQGKSTPEDLTALSNVVGTATDPILIEGNCFKGGGPSESGGGIMTGQHGGSHIKVQNNTLVDVGQYGIAIAGGDHIQILNNKIKAKQAPWTNVGIYAWGQFGAACSDNTVSGNEVDYVNSSGAKNSAWNGGNCGALQGWDSNKWAAALSGVDCSLDGPTAAPVAQATPAPVPQATPAPVAQATPAPAAQATPAPAAQATPAPAAQPTPAAAQPTSQPATTSSSSWWSRLRRGFR